MSKIVCKKCKHNFKGDLISWKTKCPKCGSNQVEFVEEAKVCGKVLKKDSRGKPVGKNTKGATKLECMKCGRKFSSSKPNSVRCPKCGSYDIDLQYEGVKMKEDQLKKIIREEIENVMKEDFGSDWKNMSKQDQIEYLKKLAQKKRARSGSSTALECMECGKKFRRKNPGINTKCPKCGGYDIDIAY